MVAEHVPVQVENHLAGAFADIDEHAVVVEARLARGIRDELQHSLRLGGVELPHLAEARHVPLRQDEQVHVFPYSPRPGTASERADPVPPAVKKERSARLRAASHQACLERWRSKVGTEDIVLVDRPGRGYGDDYSPWLVDAPVGSLVRVRGDAVSEEGIVAA